MSLQGSAAAESVLRGKINGLDMLVITAYDIAVKHGFEGTEEEWAASLNTVDSALSTTSANPVQNKVVTAEINGIKSNMGNIETALDSIIAQQQSLIGGDSV